MLYSKYHNHNAIHWNQKENKKQQTMNYTLAPNTPPAIPLDATVLVTGVSGYIGSHVADQLLLAGYRVRGTVRDEAKGETVRELFAGKYGNDRITTVVVADMSIPGAYDEACQGTHSQAPPP